MSTDYRLFAWFGCPLPDGHKRITVGPGFRVDGGSEDAHKRVVVFSEHFIENLRTAKPETVRETMRVFSKTMKDLSNE